MFESTFYINVYILCFVFCGSEGYVQTDNLENGKIMHNTLSVVCALDFL